MPKDWGSRSTDPDPGRRLPGDRGTSEIIGVVLLFGMVLAGVAIVAMSGMSAVDQAKDSTDLEAATVSMETLRSEMGGMAYDNQSQKQFEFAADNTEKVGVSQDGYLSFSVNGLGACTANRSMGMVKYQQDDGDLLAYEANAIWKKTGGGDTVMVAPPKFEYRNETIHGATYRTFNYPLVNVNATRSDYSRSSQLTVEDVGNMRAEMERQMCLREPTASNIDEVDNVTIKVTGSQFHDGWADHFRETFEGVPVHHNASNRTVIVRLPLGRVPGSCAGQPPTASFFAKTADGTKGRNVTVNRNESVTLYGSATDTCDPDRSIANRSMTLPDGTPDGVTVNASTVTYSWATPGTKTVEFWVQDQDGDVATRTVQVNVRNGGPVGGGPVGGSCTPTDPTVSLEAETPNGTRDDDRVTVDVNDSVRFYMSDSGEDDCGPDPGIRTRRLIGYNLNEYGNVTTSHSWSQPGLYTVSYLVRDNEGNVSVARVDVEVTTHGGGPGTGPGGGHADHDGDGVPDSADDCPRTPGAGENGCDALREENDGLRVNQSSGSLRVLGSQITERNVTTGRNRKSMDVMFVLDGTGSMDDNDPDEERVEATKSFVGMLNASTGDRAGWVEFRIWDWACFDDQVYEECSTLHQGLTGDFGAVNRSVENVHDRGSTYIGSGIDKATVELRSTSNEKQIIVLLTDGVNRPSRRWNYVTQDDLNTRTKNRARDAAAAGITIYAVGLSENADQDLLDDVARLTGGEDYQVDDADELETVFEKIAGEEIEPSRFVEYKNTSTTINVEDTPDPEEISVGDVNAPGSSGNDAKNISQGDPGWLLSLTTSYSQCESPINTGSPVEYDGETYNRTDCAGSTPVETVDGSDASHRIYLDGEEVPEFEGDADKPWKSSVGEIVRRYDDSLVEGGKFDLGPNRAVIVTRFSPGNFTVSLFEADDTPPASPGCGRPGVPNAVLNVSPGPVVSKGSTVDFSASATDTDGCGIGAPIQDESLTGDGPSGTAFSVSEPDPDTDHAWSSTGVYQVTYQFEDNDAGGPYNVVKQVTVVDHSGTGANCVNGDPEASVGASKGTVAVGEEVTITGSMRDTDVCGAGIVSYDLSGPGVSTDDDASATVSWSTTGTKTIQFEVRDNEGNVTTDTVQVTVVDNGTVTGNPGPDDGFVIGIGGDEVVVGVDD